MVPSCHAVSKRGGVVAAHEVPHAVNPYSKVVKVNYRKSLGLTLSATVAVTNTATIYRYYITASAITRNCRVNDVSVRRQSSKQWNYNSWKRFLHFETTFTATWCGYGMPTASSFMWQPGRAADTSTNWRQSLFCCCTASMEQATDGAETAAIDGLVSSWSENISVWFCLRAPGARFSKNQKILVKILSLA